MKTDLTKLSPPYMPGYLLGGQFVFLGNADKGSPEFDSMPPWGVVKVLHLPPDCRPGTDGTEPTRCGFFRCWPWQWRAFKQAQTAWDGQASWGRYDTLGSYPVARTVIVPWGRDRDRHPTGGDAPAAPVSEAN